jgi:hypothetical protein
VGLDVGLAAGHGRPLKTGLARGTLNVMEVLLAERRGLARMDYWAVRSWFHGYGLDETVGELGALQKRELEQSA